MKVAVSSTGPTIDDEIDPRFGRCAYFVIVETDDMNYESFDNESIALGGGAGIQSAQFVVSKGAKAVITGNCGPNAVEALSASNVEVFVGQSGIVKDAVKRHKKGDVKSTSTPNVVDHYGMQSGGSGIESGMGRGMGKSCRGGRGMGRGMGMGRRMAGSPLSHSDRLEPFALSKDEELKRLKNHVSQLQKQIEAMEKK